MESTCFSHFTAFNYGIGMFLYFAHFTAFTYEIGVFRCQDTPGFIVILLESELQMNFEGTPYILNPVESHSYPVMNPELETLNPEPQTTNPSSSSLLSLQVLEGPCTLS